jgi:CheY-like chemotaxis protein
VGRGSEFRFRLPLAVEEGAPAGAAVPGMSAAAGRVLIIEDNRDAAASLRLLLEVHGYRVELAGTGPDGVAAARRWRPDAVACDLGLPGMDGYEVVKALRQDPATAAARIVAVSGYGGGEVQRLCREAGFDQLLVKPVEFEELRRALAGG